MPLYSEHLSYCSDDGHLYDLLPIPFTDEAVRHTAARIARVQDVGSPHRGGKRVLLPGTGTGDGRTGLHQRRACRSRLRPAAGRQQRLRQRLQPRLRRRRVHRWPARRPHRSPARGRASGRGTGPEDRYPRQRGDRPGLGAAGTHLCAHRRSPHPARTRFHFPPYAELRGELQTIRRLQAVHAEAAYG